MEEVDDSNYIPLGRQKVLKRRATCIHSAGGCVRKKFGLRCERIDCSQQHYPVMFRVDGRMLSGPEYQTYLVHGTVPCPT